MRSNGLEGLWRKRLFPYCKLIGNIPPAPSARQTPQVILLSSCSLFRPLLLLGSCGSQVWQKIRTISFDDFPLIILLCRYVCSRKSKKNRRIKDGLLILSYDRLHLCNYISYVYRVLILMNNVQVHTVSSYSRWKIRSNVWILLFFSVLSKLFDRSVNVFLSKNVEEILINWIKRQYFIILVHENSFWQTYVVH